MTTRNDIVAIARGYLGTRFAHQGRHAEDGLDCLGFLFAIADSAHITLEDRLPATFDRRDYGTRPDTDFLRARLAQLLLPVSDETIRMADILLLRIEGRAQHLAMVTDYPQAGELGIIHAYAPARRVVEHRLDEHWRASIDSAYRLPLFVAD